MKSNSKSTKKCESKEVWLADQTCHHCNHKGHFIRECLNNKKDKDLQGGGQGFNLVATIQIHTPACMLTAVDGEELTIYNFGVHVHMF